MCVLLSGAEIVIALSGGARCVVVWYMVPFFCGLGLVVQAACMQT
jgi:hypothetical protein